MIKVQSVYTPRYLVALEAKGENWNKSDFAPLVCGIDNVREVSELMRSRFK